MSFNELFWPLLCALCGWSIILEAMNIGLAWFIKKRRDAKMEEIKGKIARGEELSDEHLGEFDPLALASLLGSFGQHPLPPTASGSAEGGSSVGQYL